MFDFLNMIPEEFADFLKRKYSSSETEYEAIIEDTYEDFFAFWTPSKITSTTAVYVEKFVMLHFILRRIGCGNSKKWEVMFRSKWLSVMDLYENLLDVEEKREELVTNPFFNNGYTKTGSNSKSGSGQNSESGSSTEVNRYLDTPQGNASHVWNGENLNDTYLTDIRAISDSSSRSGNNSNSESGSFSETKTGAEGITPGAAVKEYQDSFLPLLERICDEMEECFYSVVELDDFV